MRYGKDIVKRITEEIQKMPNVRYVCQKVGIDHSTFYRWMDKHFEFHQAVEHALAVGRWNINDAAEAVIIGGIQNQDFKASTFWLAHNSGRYANYKIHERISRIEDMNIRFLKEKTPPNSPFETLFEHYALAEEKMGTELARKHMEPMIGLTLGTDPRIKDIFYSAYEEQKVKRKIEKEMRAEVNFGLTTDDLDSPDQSVITVKNEDTDGGPNRVSGSGSA